MKKPVAVVPFVVVCACALVAVWTRQTAAEASKTAVVWPAAEIRWADSPATQGAKVAVLWGDPATGGYGALKTIPGGASLPLHSHTHDQRVITIAGTISLSIDGAAARDLTAGSYTFIPGGLKHAPTCKPGGECIYFEEQTGPSDVHWADPAKK